MRNPPTGHYFISTLRPSRRISFSAAHSFRGGRGLAGIYYDVSVKGSMRRTAGAENRAKGGLGFHGHSKVRPQTELISS
jgi:hypothetical protein